MNGLILVVGDKSHSALITHLVDFGGYFCFSARGLIKVNDVLNNNDIGLIIWITDKIEKNLLSDYMACWKKNNDIPVINLFKSNSIDQNHNINNLVEAMPLESSQEKIIEIVKKHYNYLSQTENSELEFRNLVSRLMKNKKKTIPRKPFNSKNIYKLNTENTSINLTERISLSSINLKIYRPHIKYWKFLTFPFVALKNKNKSIVNGKTRK